MKIRLLAGLLCGMALATGTAGAQTKPNGIVSIVVPQPAGNPTDGTARKLQPLLQKELGQNVIVENAPGAGGSIGVQKALNPPPGVTTILIASQTEPILTPLTIKQARYKAEDFRPIALVGRAAYILTARPGLPAKDHAELVALARQSAAPLSFGNIGPGSMIHLLGEQWARKTGVELTQVPYRGVPPVAQDLMADQIDLTFMPLGGATLSMLGSGKMKPIANSGPAVHPLLPNVPTASSTDASMADFVYGTWIALLIPATASDETAERLNRAIVNAMQDADFLEYLRDSGAEINQENSLAALDEFYTTETALYRQLAEEIGVTAD